MTQEVKPILTDDGRLLAAVQLGSLGGSSKSDKKRAASKRNGSCPARPGNRKGRPPGSKNKKK